MLNFFTVAVKAALDADMELAQRRAALAALIPLQEKLYQMQVGAHCDRPKFQLNLSSVLRHVGGLGESAR
jgi:hypothetical protein